MAKKQFSMLLTEQDIEKIEQLKANKGITRTSDVFRQSVSEYYNKTFPAYIQERQSGKKRTHYDNPMEKVKALEEKKKIEAEAKHALVIETGMALCEQLNGEFIKQENGNLACKFAIYDRVNANRVMTGSRTMPIEDLHEAHVTAQYKNGSKEEIQAILKKQ